LLYILYIIDIKIASIKRINVDVYKINIYIRIPLILISIPLSYIK